MSPQYGWLLVFLTMTYVNISLARGKNPTRWPYGGVPDNNGSKQFSRKIVLNFSRANFNFAKFDSLADFRDAYFAKRADFQQTHFNHSVYFSDAHFTNNVYFSGAHFHSPGYFQETQFAREANFKRTHFHKRVHLSFARFGKLAFFSEAKFDSLADFKRVQFSGRTNFRNAKFNRLAFFKNARFNRHVDFRRVQFNHRVDFSGAKFDSLADFKQVRFKDKISFNSAILNRSIDFRQTAFDNLAAIDFSLATIKDTLFVGIHNASKLQKYDFIRANFLEKHREVIKPDTVITVEGDTIYQSQQTNDYPGAKIILHGPVALKIQLEKFKFIELCDTLDYYAKKDIISTLKDSSFNENKHTKERFELDFIFTKSTMYQEPTTNYELNEWYAIWKWFPTWIYYITMGLGYRPFWLLYWVLGILLLFTFIYFRWIPEQINQYIFEEKHGKELTKPEKKAELSFSEKVIHCLYFSSMVLFTFRLRKDILTFFEIKHKRVIVFEWLIGFIIYLSFLTLSKAGSILHTLKSLFVG